MRNKLTIWTAALLCSASLANAQPQEAAPATPGAVTGVIDFGFRGGALEDDYARYERYRDLRDGAFSRINFGQDKDVYNWSAGARNIGYRDQYYFANFTNGKSRLSGSFDAIPLNYSYLTSTPWVETQTGIFTLDPAARLAVQSRTPGVVGIPTTAAQLSTPSIYRTLASQFDLRSRRDTLGAAYAYDFNRELGFNLSFATTKKGGKQPYSMSFAFNNANELPIPLDHRTNEFAAGLEYARDEGMIRLGWESSFFNQNIASISWDNPLRLTDTNPYDPSGYSNGNGPAFGRMAMPPSNSLSAVSLTGLYKMPGRTTINGLVSFTAMNQNDALIPWTSNSVINSPGVIAAFPHLAQLPRETAEAKVHGVNALFNMTSRPNRYFGMRMRYRFNDHKNLTPAFDAREYVRFDAVPEETGSITQNFNITQNTFDLTGTFNVVRYATLNVGYVFDSWDRTGRSFSDMRDHTLRTSLDFLGNQWVTIRANYDHTNRIGSGFSEASIEEGGYQGGLRFYDEADRKRDRGTVLVSVNPIDMIDITALYSKARDQYEGPGFEFGLLDNDNDNITVVLGVTPTEFVNFGVSYGRDHYVANQKSRNANPPPDPTWTDPARDWTLKNEEIVNNVDVFLNIPQAIRNTNIRINYDYSDSDNGFTFGGPRIVTLTAARTFLPLPNVTNKWHRLSADLQYRFAQRVGFGFGYWYEKLDITDFATVDLAPNSPRIDYLGGLMTGYGNRPYKGSTAFIRVLYFF